MTGREYLCPIGVHNVSGFTCLIKYLNMIGFFV